MRALLTGGTGFVGSAVARALLRGGWQVRALARPNSDRRNLAGLELETVEGDLGDVSSLERAAKGCTTLFHVAADYRLGARRPQELYQTNVQGTRNVLSASRKVGIERVVYTSSVATIGLPADGSAGNEATPVALADMIGHYKRSKFLAERVAVEFAVAGLPVLIVNPTAPVGDHDIKPTPTGQIVLDFLKGDMPAFIDTGLNLVDARDVALGHIQACERGRAGERYILGAENLTLEQILGKLAAITGRPAPTLQLPYAVAYAAGVVSTAWARVSGKSPRAPLDAVRMARRKMFVSHAKAARELGYDPGPPQRALARAVEWFRANGYC